MRDSDVWQQVIERLELHKLPQEIAALRDRILRELYLGGARLPLGADSPRCTMCQGFSLAHGIRAMIEAVLPACAVLEAATKNPAFFGKKAEFGTIEVGKRADLILLQRNPLEDSPQRVSSSGRDGARTLASEGRDRSEAAQDPAKWTGHTGPSQGGV